MSSGIEQGIRLNRRPGSSIRTISPLQYLSELGKGHRNHCAENSNSPSVTGTARLRKTIELTVGVVEQAASIGARLVVFPEAFVSVHPAWIWRLRPGGDWGISEELHSLSKQRC